MAFLEGFGIRSYRSFGSEFVFIGPLSKVNIFIGANNSGKSNVLRFLDKVVGQEIGNNSSGNLTKLRYQNDDRPLGIQFKPGVAFGSIANGPIEKQLNDAMPGLHQAAQLALDTVLNSFREMDRAKVTWYLYQSQEALVPDIDNLNRITSSDILENGYYTTLWQAITGQMNPGGMSAGEMMRDVFNRIGILKVPISRIRFIPAFREIGAGNQTADGYDGDGLIDRLSRLEKPDSRRYSDKRLFENIIQFTRTVTGNPTASIEIPHHKNTINVIIDNKPLPLESLGSGLQEVIILAAAATEIQNQIVCIEEPELHLHPLLQKQLLKYLVDKTDNQYFITTHSAHLLDTPNAEIFHVRLVDGWSRIERATTDHSKSEICSDLGFRASDLQQANCIVWVEGPTDREYIAHWLKHVDPELQDGMHYSLMIYGGRLLEHLSTLDHAQLVADAKTFISLRRLNRFIALVMDSDKASVSTELEEWKMRVLEEFQKTPGFAWVTEGRSIENYYPSDAIKRAMKALHPNSKTPAINTKYSYATRRLTKAGKETDVIKTKLAEWLITNESPPLSQLGLRETLEALSNYIRKANGLPQLSNVGT